MDSCSWHLGFCLWGNGCFSKVLGNSHLEAGCLPWKTDLKYMFLSVWLGEIFPFRGLEDIISEL